MKKISKNQIKEFYDNGFLIIKDIIDINKLKKINSIYKKIFNGHYQTEIAPDKIKWKPNRDSPSIPRSLCNVWKSDKNIAQVVCSKTISSIAGQLMNWNSVRLNQDSLITVVGASGIVSGLMGAYVYLFPNAKLLVLVPFGILFPTTIKAKFFMISWFVSQIFIAISSTNISWEAHIGGFIIGYTLLKILNYKRYNF